MNKLELVQAWQAEMPTEQDPRIGHKSLGIFALQLTPDNRYALTLNFQYRELIVWDFASGQRLFSHSWGGYDKVRGLYLTPDGDYAVVTGETGGIVQITPSLQNIRLRDNYVILNAQGQPRLLPQEDYVIVNAQSQRAISSNGIQARVWDFEKNQFGITLENPTIKRDDERWDPLYIGSISANGGLGAGMFDNHALVWNLENGRLLWQHDFSGHKPYHMIFSPDGQQIILNNDSRIETWRWSTDKMDGPTFETGGGRIHSSVFTPNGKTIITGTKNGAIQIWDWPDGKLRRILGGHKYEIKKLAVSADGEDMASVSNDTTLRKWHIPSGKQIFSTLRAETDMQPLSIDPSGRYAIAPYGHDKATMAVYDLTNGTLQQTLQGHHGDVNVIDYLADGCLLTGSDDHTLRIWNLESGENIQTLSGEHTGQVKAAVSVHDHNQIVSAGRDGRIVRWDLATGRPTRTSFNYALPTNWTEQYVFIDQHGRQAITNKVGANHDHVISVLFNLENGNELLEWGGSLPGFSNAGGMLSPNGHWLVQCKPLWKEIKAIDLKTQQRARYNLDGRVGDLWCFTTDERTLVCTYELGKVVMIDLQSGAYRFASVKPATPPSTRITALTLSPDGRLGAIAAEEHIRIWELSSGEELASLNTGAIFFELMFDPRNRYILAGGNNKLCCFALRDLIG